MKKIHKLVVKLGTSTLTKGTKSLSRKHMLEYARQLAQMHEAGMDIVIVTSGAVAAGREVLQHPKVERTLPSKQMFAAVGQGRLMQVWSELFSIYNIVVGQILLTRDDFSNRQRYLNVRDTLASLLDQRVIPIINENDSIAIKHIKVGDNDNLSALVSNLIAADLLIILTDQQGLYTADPRAHPEAKLIPVVEHIDDSVMALAGGAAASLGLGTGGMVTKLEAARLASQSGTPTVIASYAIPNVLVDLAHGQKVGTLFQAETTSRESRKRWLLSEKKQGTIFVDRGAEEGLRHHGASLLAVGITGTSGSFDRGAIVHIASLEGKIIGTGMASYSSQEIGKLVGSHSNQIESLLGYSYGHEIVHRDNMILVK